MRAKNVIVLGVEKKSTAVLQEDRTMRKICKLDSHLTLAFAGLTADARVLINKARIECQSFRLTVEDAPTVEYIARFIARIQQRYTQRGGRRPFGLSTLIAGFNRDGSAHMYQTDPSGVYSEWAANAIGRNFKTVREYLEKHYDLDDDSLSEEAAVKLTIQALLEVVESGSKNIEVAVLRPGKDAEILSSERVAEVVKQIVKEKEEAEPAKAAEAAAAKAEAAAAK